MTVASRHTSGAPVLAVHTIAGMHGGIVTHHGLANGLGSRRTRKGLKSLQANSDLKWWSWGLKGGISLASAEMRYRVCAM